MRRGVWHQCGDRSQKLAAEQIQNGLGVGVIISPRDLSCDNAAQRAQEYHGLGAQVLLDQQFYLPDSTIGRLNTYPISQHRNTISQLNQISDPALSQLAQDLEAISRAIDADAVIAPAIVYEAGRPDIADLNVRLFRAARAVGDTIGKPVYASVVLGRSITSTTANINAALSHATALDSNGYYFAFEFEPERIPSRRDAVGRCLAAGLALACTGRPVLHAYAGPMGLLSFGFAATGVAIGHSQNLWKFDLGRWVETDGQGGGGDAPARYFSDALWGTIIHPDETSQLSQNLAGQILTPSPFTNPWSRWQANKHLLHCVGTRIAAMAPTLDPQTNIQTARTVLNGAVAIHTAIAAAGLQMKDGSNSYQQSWRLALDDLQANNQADFDYLTLMG